VDGDAAGLKPSATPPITETIIRPRTGWGQLKLAELWDYRELLYFFVWRDLKVRYKQTAFGALWAIIQPTLLMIVFSIFVGRVSGVGPPGIAYPVFAFAGLVHWTLFSQSLVGSAQSLVESSNLLQKVYFPRLLLPIAAIGSYLVDFAIALLLLGLLVVGFGIPLTFRLAWLLPLTVLALATASAIGIWLSAINVRYRDVRYALPFLVQLWLLASPVAYRVELVPEQWRWLYHLNPMAGVVEGFQWAILGTAAPPLDGLLESVIVTALILVSGLIYFRRVERTFADVI
jgi:lipopolysaccharide transport system permease protein